MFGREEVVRRPPDPSPMGREAPLLRACTGRGPATDGTWWDRVTGSSTLFPRGLPSPAFGLEDDRLEPLQDMRMVLSEMLNQPLV